MSKPIQLLPGLSIHFAEDGVWFHFEGERHSCGFHLENKLGDDPVVGRAIQEWIKGKRESGLFFDKPVRP